MKFTSSYVQFFELLPILFQRLCRLFRTIDMIHSLSLSFTIFLFPICSHNFEKIRSLTRETDRKIHNSILDAFLFLCTLSTICLVPFNKFVSITSSFVGSSQRYNPNVAPSAESSILQSSGRSLVDPDYQC